MVLNGCGVTIPDSEWCADAGSYGAICFHTLTKDTRDIPLAAWQIERFGQVCTKADSFAKIKAAIEKLCHQSGQCNVDLQKQITDTFSKVDSAVKKSKDPLCGLKHPCS